MGSGLLDRGSSCSRSTHEHTRVPAAETSDAISGDAGAHARAGWAQPLRGPGQQQLEHAAAAGHSMQSSSKQSGDSKWSIAAAEGIAASRSTGQQQ